MWPRTLTEAVVNTKPVVNKVVVNNRRKDRHKDGEARKVYLREYMRRKRAAAKTEVK